MKVKTVPVKFYDGEPPPSTTGKWMELKNGMMGMEMGKWRAFEVPIGEGDSARNCAISFAKSMYPDSSPITQLDRTKEDEHEVTVLWVKILGKDMPGKKPEGVTNE